MRCRCWEPVEMIPKVTRCCLFLILSYISDAVQSSSTADNLYAFTTLADTEARTETFGDRILGTGTTTVEKYSDPYGGGTEFTTDGQVYGDKILGSETGGVTTYSDPYGGSTEFTTDNAALHEEPSGPPDHMIPYSEHETPGDIPTRPKYSVPGAWAKPPPDKGVPLEFVPTKMYSQVRGTHTVKRLPKSDAAAEATTDEEKANAPRLREVVSKTKVNTVYSEEGYEDSAYDHGGHVRDADFHEGYAKKLHDERDSRKAAGRPRRRKNRKKNVKKTKHDEFEEFADDYRDEPPVEDYGSEASTRNEKRKKDQNRIYRGMWKKAETDPKIVTENGIKRLENDLRKEAEEAEKGSENYEFAEKDRGKENTRERAVTPKPGKSRKKSRSRSNVGRTAEPRHEWEQTTGYPASTTKEKLYKENYEATTIEFDLPTKPDGSVKNEAFASGYGKPTTNGYVVGPTTISPLLNYDPTTFGYGPTTASHPPADGESPTTINYSQQFWGYFKSNSDVVTTPQVHVDEPTTIQQPFLIQETTTLEPRTEHQTPVALATINGHGPYLLVTDNEESTGSPEQYETGRAQIGNLASGSTHGIRNAPYLGNDRRNVLAPDDNVVNGRSRNGRRFPNLNSIPGDKSFFENGRGTARPQNGQFTPTLLRVNGPAMSVYEAWKLNNGEYNAKEVPVISTEPSRYFDSVAFGSTPTYSVITKPPNGFQSIEATPREDPKFGNNPFLNAGANSLPEESQNREYSGSTVFGDQYGGWSTVDRKAANEYPDSKVSSVRPEVAETVNEGDKSFFNYKPNLNYEKMLDYIKDEKKSQFGNQDSLKIQGSHDLDGKKGESGDSEDFTIMKPPMPGVATFPDFAVNSYANVMEHSSVIQESETPEGAGPKKSHKKENTFGYDAPQYNKTIFKSPIVQRYRSPVLNSRKNPFPASKLLPPAPDTRDEYAAHSMVSRRNEYYKPTRHPNRKNKQNYGKTLQSYNPNPEKLAQYLNARRSPQRYKRSSREMTFNEEKIADFVIAREIDERFNEDVPNDKNEPEAKSRSKRGLIPEETQSVTEDAMPAAVNLQLQEKRRSEEGRNYTRRDKRSNEDLLNASHKIAGDVIDEEINARFNDKENDEDDEEDDDETEAKGSQVEVDVPDFEDQEEIQDVNEVEIPSTTKRTIDFQKYPFYKNEKFSSSSPLSYIINPREVPRKTLGGMEFYDSRDKYMQCDEVDPDLEQVVPDDEEPVPNRGPKKNLPRLRGLGDKLDCFKAKYFDENPLDNPLFFEKRVSQPTPPSELDPRKFASRILKLPEENEAYVIPAQSKRPESIRTRSKRPDTDYHSKSRISAKTAHVKDVTDLKTGRGRDVVRSENRRSSTERPKQKRRHRGRRPTTKPAQTTTAIPITDPVTPYQKEVYDDVMGTIKNLASFYELFEAQTAIPVIEAPTLSPKEHRIATAASISNVKALNHISTSMREKETGFPLLDITESPRSEVIEGLVPPPKMTRNAKILPYRTNKVSYNTRVRTEDPPENSDEKIVGYFRTVTVHKRSLDDDNDVSQTAGNVDSLKHTLQKRNVVEGQTISKRANRDTVSTTKRPVSRSRRKFSIATTTPASEARSETEKNSQKVVYTIRGRTRNSKSKKDVGRNGKFTTTEKPSTTVDARRNEPRYNRINRRRGLNTSSGIVSTTAGKVTLPVDSTDKSYLDATTTTTGLEPDVNETTIEDVTVPGEIYLTEHSSFPESKADYKSNDPYDEFYNTAASDHESEDIEEDDEGHESYEEEEPTREPEKQKIRKYDVHEDIQEASTQATVGVPAPVKTPEHSDLETFLLTDPPGFDKVFADVTTGPSASYKDDGDREKETENYRKEESKSGEAEDDEDHTDRTKDSYREDDSSEKSEEVVTEPSRYLQSYKDSIGENDDSSENSDKKNTERGNDKTFFRYVSRPVSSYENYEDEKFSDLGPRVNKPAFYHPPFKSERPFHENHEEMLRNEELDESDESKEKEKYVFPWIHDEENEKQGYNEQTTEKYEYPWDKRERLKRDRERRQWKTGKYRDFSIFDDDDDDDSEEIDKSSPSETHGRYMYPWEHYDMPSKKNRGRKKNLWGSSTFDSDRESSEHRPVAKFSSKYSNDKFKYPLGGQQSIFISTAEPTKIEESVMEFMRDGSVDESKMLSTIQPKHTEPSASTVIDTTPEELLTTTSTLSTSNVIHITPKEPSTTTSSPISRTNKRLSNVRIIPENVTTAPRKRGRGRYASKTERTTLKPSVETSTEMNKTSKATQTGKDDTAKKLLRSRGKYNTRMRDHLTKSASEVVTTTVKPTERVNSPKRDDSTVRRRGNSRGNQRSIEPEKSDTEMKREKNTDRFLPSANTNRGRSRHRVTTVASTAETVREKVDDPRKSSGNEKTKSKSAKKSRIDVYEMPNKSSMNTEDMFKNSSSPTSKTIEHRSRVSKEELITKTSFPNEDTMYGLYTDEGPVDNKSTTTHKPRRKYSNTPRRVTSLSTESDSEDVNPVKNESVEKVSIVMKETPGQVYETKRIEKDGVKGMFVSIVPNDRTMTPSSLGEDLQLKDAEMEELERRTEGHNEFDRIRTEAGSDGDDDEDEETGSFMSEDRNVLGNLPVRTTPRSNHMRETYDEDEEYEDEEDSEESEETDEEEDEDEESEEEDDKPKARLIKDPNHRLYYYVVDRK